MSGIQKVLREKYAYLMESPSLEYSVNQNCELQQIGGLLDSKGFGFATQQSEHWPRIFCLFSAESFDRCGVSFDRCAVFSDRCGVFSDRCGVSFDRCGVSFDRCGVFLRFHVYTVCTVIWLADSPYRDMISKTILRLQENSELENLKDKWWKKNQCNAGKAQDTNSELGLANVGGVFIILLGGIIVSLFVAAAEFLFSVRKVTRVTKVRYGVED